MVKTPGPDAPALTVHNPWAGLIAVGHKTVENRVWRTTHRGPLLIHAGLTVDHGAYTLPHVADGVARAGTAAGIEGAREAGANPYLARGAIIAAVLLTDVHPPAPGGCCHPWGEALHPLGAADTDGDPDTVLPEDPGGLYHWVLTEPWILTAPVPAPGRQRLWHPDPDTLTAVWAQRDAHAPTWTRRPQ